MDPSRTYTLLLLEDSEADAFLMERHLKRFVPKLELLVASAREEYERHVTGSAPDLILSDYRLPHYSGIEALMFARAHAPLVPFLFVTGALHNEELAADTILKGASGFVLKNNLSKLDHLLPPLLTLTSEHGAGASRERHPVAPAEPTTRPLTPAAPPASAPDPEPTGEIGTLLSKLKDADPETLAKIKRVLDA